MLRADLVQTLDALLQPQTFKDYGPNGMQVQGRENIHKLISGVSASQALIEAAIDAGADAILVHHGLFWGGQSGCITGWMKKRLALLLQHDINLLAYHLPLDAHPLLGNNAQLAKVLGFNVEKQFGEQNLLFMGRPAQGQFASAAALAQHLQSALHRPATWVSGLAEDSPVERIAWCSGGAQRYFEAAIEAGAQAFITGEISEPQAHYARECGAAFFACGHHATERYGVQALAEAVAEKHQLQHIYIDIDNPA